MTTEDVTDETFHLELKPSADPLARVGTHREPINRLKQLLKCASRVYGFRIRWGQSTPPVELSDRYFPGDHMIRFVDGPAEGKTLMLRRAPLFLRVVYDAGRLKWDALDQLDDQPAAREDVVVYQRLGEAGTAMIDWTENGRRRGGCFATASYAVVSEQPDQAVVRDTAKWRTWCWEQVKKPKQEVHTNGDGGERHVPQAG